MPATNIVVIDDDRLVRATVKAILGDAGYQVSVAANAMEGLRAIEHGHVDLVITDLLMPDRNGFDTIRDILRRCPNMKIIVISGAITARCGSLADMIGALGVSQVLAKPFRPDQLIGLVAGVLQHRDAPAAASPPLGRANITAS